MQILIILLKTSWQSWRNIVEQGVENWRRRVLEYTGFLVLIVALYLMGRAVLDQVGGHDALRLEQVMKNFMLFGVLILAKDVMGGTLRHLYAAHDTALLLSMPLPAAMVFGFKLIVLTASNLLNICVWVMPPWIAFGQLFRLPWHFYLALIPASFCLLVIVISEIVIVMLIYLRFFLSRRISQILKVIGIVISVAVGFLLVISIGSDQSDKIAQFLLRINIPAADWQPHLWGAKLLIGWHPESDVQMWRWGVQLIVATIGLPILAVLLASKIYYRSWEYAKRVEVHPKRNQADRTEADASPPRRTQTSPIGRGRIRAIMAKDFLVFIRQRGRIMVVIILTVVILIAMFKSYTDIRADDVPEWETELALLFLGIQIMLFSVIITAGMTWDGFKAEAQTWWLLKSGPVTPELLFNSKCLTATCCSVIYNEFWMLTALVLFRVSIQLGLLILLATTLTTAMVIAFNTAIGTLPWMVGIQRTDQEKGSGSNFAASHQFLGEKGSIARMATLGVAITANIILVSGPMFILLTINLLNEAYSDSEQFLFAVVPKIIVGVMVLFMVGVWYISYLMGRRSLRKLLG